MNHLIIKYSNQIKRVSIPKTNSVDDFYRIMEQIFRIKQKIVGVIDEHGKFYDLQFVNDHLKILKNQHLELITAKDTNQENMSFASDNIQNYETKKGEQLTNESYPIQKTIQGFLGYINDIQLFQQLLLEDKKLVIVICSQHQKTNLKILYNFYLLENNKQSVIIYYNRKKICQLFVDDWKYLQNNIDVIIKNLYLQEKIILNQHYDGEQKKKIDESFSDISNKSFNMQNQMAIQQIKSTFLQNIAKLRDQQTISQLEYYKLKSKLYENPQQFMRKYQMGTRQGFRKRKSIDELRQQIIKSKQQKSRYQTIINQFRQLPTNQQPYNKNLKTQIPIIVRKYNNVIQKISTSYPLTIQQQQAINLIMQLQLKGLITQNQSRYYKLEILQQQIKIFQLFNLYFNNTNNNFDQIQFVNKLKNLKNYQINKKQQCNKFQDIIRLIIKYAKRNSFELLRKLAIQGNTYILKSYDQYQKDKNANLFARALEKIACYYRAKFKLEQGIQNQQ